MKSNIPTFLAAAAILVGSGMVAVNAAESSSMKPTNEKSLTLTSAQQRDITQSVKGQRAETAPAGFKAAVGEKVPASIRLRALSKTATREVPAVKSYDFAMLRNQVLIVDPKTRQITDVIEQ